MSSALRVLVAFGLLLLAACGGGGGDSSSAGDGDSSGGGSGSGGGSPGNASTATFSIASQSLVFSAASPTSPTPAMQVLAGTVSGTASGTLYVVITPAGQAIASVSNVRISGNTGTAQVSVTPPAALGSGTFTGTIQVRACMNDVTCATGELNGSPRIVNVTYTVGTPTVPDGVMPHVITAGNTGQLVIRGHGFTGTSNVSFGGTPAASITVVSDSEIHASYPALGVGNYSVTLTGTVFSGSVAAVAPIAFASQLLAYPEQPYRVRKVMYDAERQALYVAANFSTSANSKLWRYRYASGAWSLPEVIAIPDLEDVTLSQDGARLIVLTSSSVSEYDSANPMAGPLKTTMAPAEVLSQLIPVTDATFVSDAKHPVALTSIALANDGTALITARYRDVDRKAYLFFYSRETGTFTQMQPFASFGMYAPSSAGGAPPAVASADGSRVLATATYSMGDPAEAILQFTASAMLTKRVSATTRQYWGRSPAVDASASRIIPFQGPGFTDPESVYDGSFNLLGNIPKSGTLNANSMVLHPSGTRAYVLTLNPFPFNTTVHTFDLTAMPVAGAFPEIGSPLTISSPTASHINLVLGTISPDGETLFFAGDGGVSIAPALQ